MIKKPIAVEKFLILLVLAINLISCKNGEGESSGFFSTAEEFTPTTAAELREWWEADSENTKYTQEVHEFYKSRSYAPFWTEEDLIKAFEEELNKAEEEGLSTGDYYSSELKKILSSETERTEAERVNLEVLLTNSFFQYAEDLFYGKLDPKELYSLWGIKRKALDLEQILASVSGSEDIISTLDSLKPRHPIYSGLKTSLREFKTQMKGDSTVVKIAEGKTIKPGDRDSRTVKVAERLHQLGLLERDSVKIDSIYSENLVAAIKRFQQEKDLEPDGVIGNTTLKELNRDSSDLYKKVLVNLERWRWYPRDLGDHYILVNVADFKLAVVKDGDTVRTHNVIAGSKQRQTPVFTDTLEYIVINPLWNIPPTIQKEDIIPKASRNPSYLTNNHMTVTAPNGNVLNPYDIDWSKEEVKNYRFSQSAGPSNPLGRVKIIYPNKYLIYLHDTPSKALFNRSDRAESSGCVRVENAIDLSAYVVENQDDWSLEKIKQQIASGKTKHVKIKRPIQVHHFYWTAWRGLDKTYFADDVYDLDAEVYEALTKAP